MKIIDNPQYHIFKNGTILSNPKNKYHKPKFLCPWMNTSGYKRVTLSNRKKYYLHRLIAIHFIPNPHNYQEVDHKNRNTLDNRIENLRWVSKSQNQQNTGVSKNNKVGIKNISYKGRNIYEYRKIINKVIHYKSFKTLEEAIEYKKDYESRNEKIFI